MGIFACGVLNMPFKTNPFVLSYTQSMIVEIVKYVIKVKRTKRGESMES